MGHTYKVVIPSRRLIPKQLFESIQKSIPIICVDLIVFRKKDKAGLEVLLAKRKIPPEIGKWVLIGGRVMIGETLKRAIQRQAKREFSVTVRILPPWDYNNPIRVFDNPKFDPQKHAIALAYPVVIKDGMPRMSGPEFSEIRWFGAEKLPSNLGFNGLHRQEIMCAVKALRGRKNLKLN